LYLGPSAERHKGGEKVEPINLPGGMTAPPVVVALFAGLLAGCASEPPPASLVQARTAVEQARQAPAGEYAELELREAQEKLSEANEAAEDEENERAERFAQEALINVQLAEAKAEMERAQKAADELAASTQTLRQETERTTDAIAPGAGVSQ
jgi:hypothetical protein